MKKYVLDLSAIEGTYCYCSPSGAEAARAVVADLPLEGVHFIGTGDYHYASYFFLERIREPFALVLFDNHPDDQEGAFGDGLLSCGGWVAWARRDLPLLSLDVRNSADIPAELPVYLSIDLDVLSTEFARTDWDQGDMTLNGLLDMIGLIRRHHRILGADICGGLANPATCILDLNRRAEEAIAAAIIR